MTVRISLYDPTLTYPGQKRFDCGNEAVNKFARDSLKAQVRKSLSAAYVLTDAAQAGRFVGFLTIAQHSIDMSLLSPLRLGSLPKHIPCSRVIMLGVDKDYQKRNLGVQLMKEAFRVSKTAAKAIGSYGIFLLAEPGAIGFYQKLGFTLLQGDLTPAASPMFLPMSGIP
ncbi:MAG TPA: GNAT family N-acetyltransferase [Telluria sp.]|nr:GNAT family N-acetyltransferase [Telluria sp.]